MTVHYSLLKRFISKSALHACARECLRMVTTVTPQKCQALFSMDNPGAMLAVYCFKRT